MSDANHPRDRIRDQCVRDPGVTRGRFKVLARTDGLFVVYDPLMPIGKATVAGPFATVGEATVEAERLALLRPGALG